MVMVTIVNYVIIIIGRLCCFIRFTITNDINMNYVISSFCWVTVYVWCMLITFSFNVSRKVQSDWNMARMIIPSEWWIGVLIRLDMFMVSDIPRDEYGPGIKIKYDYPIDTLLVSQVNGFSSSSIKFCSFVLNG